MSKIHDASAVRPRLVRQAPDLRPEAVERLTRMYSEPRLLGTGSAEPVEIDPKVRISIAEGANLHRLLKESGARSSIEIGFAYGFSTVWLLDALAGRKDARHIAIDPFEEEIWDGIGLKQVELLGSEVSFEWIAQSSILALPELLARDMRADFVFIDSGHLFDETLVEFFLADKLLAVGGIMAFDDQWMPSMRSVTDFVLRNRSYERVKQPVRALCALRKTAEDKRHWEHFQPFRTSDPLPLAIANRIRRALPSLRA